MIFAIGLAKMKQEMNANMGETTEQREFVASCMLALDGVQKYIRNFGFLAGYLTQNRQLAFSDAHRENLKKVKVACQSILHLAGRRYGQFSN